MYNCFTFTTRFSQEVRAAFDQPEQNVQKVKENPSEDNHPFRD